jgi:flagella basal body P-ring formation protein FlgA
MKRLALILLALALPAALVGLDLVLKDKAAVSDNVIRLRDVADLPAANGAVYADLILAPALEPGQTQTLSAAEIIDKLRGNGCARVQMSGAQVVHVMRRGHKVEAAFFVEKIRTYLLANSLWDEGVKISIPSAKAVIVPENDVDWQIIPSPGEDLNGHVLFHIRGIYKGDEIFNNWLSAKVTVEKLVAVARRSLEKADTIRDADISWEKREITPLLRKAMLSEGDVVGAKTMQYVPAHSVITADMLATALLVRRGEPARLQASLKDIVAVSTVTPLVDGRLGDRIRVMTTLSKKIIMATVSGRNELQMEIQ